jgi:hypothetical protein
MKKFGKLVLAALATVALALPVLGSASPARAGTIAARVHFTVGPYPSEAAARAAVMMFESKGYRAYLLYVGNQIYVRVYG